MRILFILFFTFSVLIGKSHDTLRITNDVFLVKLSENTYVHVSWHSDPDWGKFTCNGMVVVKNGEAALFDTPMSDDLTRKLVYFIEDSLKAEIKYFVPNHFHNDCTEGIDIVDSLGSKIISSQLTAEISKEKNIIVASQTFTDTFTIFLGNKKITLYYPGEAHSKDNIVAFVEDERILFGGCMLRAFATKSKGNVADANEIEWSNTIKRVKKKYGHALIVIPGHGDYGNFEIMEHTINLTNQKKKNRKANKD